MRAIVETYEAWSGLSHQALREHQLSPAGRQALAILEGAHHPLSPTTIAERLLVTTASVTSLLDTLERRGLVIRSPDPDDGRKVLVTLTSDGRGKVDAFLPEIVALQTAMLTSLSEAERHQLLGSLATIRDAIETLDPQAVAAAAPPRRPPKRQ